MHAVLGWGLACDPPENPGEVVCIGVTAGPADLMDGKLGVHKEGLGLLNPEIIEPRGEIGMEALLE